MLQGVATPLARSQAPYEPFSVDAMEFDPSQEPPGEVLLRVFGLDAHGTQRRKSRRKKFGKLGMHRVGARITHWCRFVSCK